LDIVAEQVAGIGDMVRPAPLVSLVLQRQLDETLSALPLVLIDQQRRNIFQFSDFKSMPENKGENRRQDQNHRQDATIAPDMEKLLIGHAHDCFQRGKFHESRGFKTE
jgi:hypothetical protein